MSRSGIADDFAHDDEEEILEHLQSIANTHSERETESQNQILKCLRHVEICANTFTEDITNQQTVMIQSLFFISLTTVYFYPTLIFSLTHLSHDHVLLLTFTPL